MNANEQASLFQPPASTVRVIAAGATADGGLRATVMFTPDGGLSETALKHWPSTLFAELRRAHWQIPLAIGVVSRTGKYAKCESKTYDAVARDAKCILWTAEAAGAAWNHASPPVWLDKLWMNDFKLPADVPEGDGAWAELAKGLERSTDNKSLSAGDDSGAKPSTFDPEKNRRAVVDKQPPNEDKTTQVDAIVPARQTELAILLEMQRSLELCATAKAAHEEAWVADPSGKTAYAQQEAKCADAAAANLVANPNDDAVKKLRAAAKDRYEKATQRIEEEICNIKCDAQEDKEIPPLPWVSFDAADMAAQGSSQRDAIDTALHGPLDSQQAANQPQDTTRGATLCEFGKQQADVGKIVNQRFYAIQGSPSLSRLYGLTVDVVLPKDRTRELLDIAGVPPDAVQTFVFLLLSIEDRYWTSTRARKVWTLSKWRPEGARPHFWPASRLEVLQDPKEDLHPAMTQYDGLVVLGQDMELTLEDGSSKRIARFELTSLDVHAASQSALDKRRRLAPSQKESTQPPAGQPVLAGRPADWARKSFSTAGFSFLDRGRLEQAASQFAARNTHIGCTNAMYLDANDLTIGYRIDVCVLGPDGRLPVWRSLMARQMEHGTNALIQNEVHRVAPLLLGFNGSPASHEWAENLDDAVMSLPARLIYTSPDRADAYVEESVAQWNGEPMAAQCAGPKVKKITLMSVGAGDAIRLPNSQNRPTRRPPALRFGQAYRFGMRVVYPGGLSMPLDDAKSHYQSAERRSAGRLSLPTGKTAAKSDTQPAAKDSVVPRMRRFLRHERIDQPSLLTPRQVADRERGVMGYERGAHAIVRTASGKSANRATPTQTKRIFAPPCVDIHFAALHGVFDGMKKMEVPEQGLKHVHYDAVGGGFPYLTTVTKPIVGYNGHTFQGPRAMSTRGDRGDLVYEEGGNPSNRPVPYYPDPAALQYVVALRYAGTPIYLGGTSKCFDIYGAGDSYPNVRLLAVNVVRQSTHRANFPPTLDDVVSQVKRSRDVELNVTLAPGEDFEIDVWCVPDPAYLADRFAVIEGIGTVAYASATVKANANAKTGVPHVDPSWVDMLVALSAILPPTVCERFADCDPEDRSKLRWVNEGIGGLEAPRSRVLGEIAKALHATLRTRPLDEIAAVQTLRATHATAYAHEVPLFAKGPRTPVVVRDVEAAILAAPVDTTSPLFALRAELRKEQQPVDDKPPADTKPVPVRPPEYILKGDLLVELASTEGFDIYARTAFPSTTQFDDRNRGRILKDKRDGTWPQGAKRPLTATEVFGFDVAADGAVTLPRVRVLLSRVENLPIQGTGTRIPDNDGRTAVPLESLGWQGNEEELLTLWGDVKVRHIFPDGKARRLDLEVVCRARHGLLMRSADSLGRNGHPLVEGSDVEDRETSGETLSCVWLEATTRPSEPVALSPIPAFVWKRTAGGKTRIAVVRIPLGRGWLSSGEEERLGIVLWPPNIFSRDPEEFANDRVSRNVSPGVAMTLDDFTDEDLGPGGRFITRWGADPLRPAVDLPSEAAPRTFVDPTAFGDLEAGQGLGFRAMPVPDVEMPVAASADDQSPTAATTLRVSLVTYEPRFDIETEGWYVDAAIEHPFEHQPFLRLGLVRYQEHAPPHLRCSLPVVQWVQLLPRRDTRVKTVCTYKDGRKVEVVVEGPGDSILTMSEAARAASTVMEPIMTVRLVRQYVNAAGISCRHVGEAREMKPEARQTGGLYSGGPIVSWKSCIDVPSTSSHSTYSVYVEERTPYLPASYAHEPVSPHLASDDMSRRRVSPTAAAGNKPPPYLKDLVHSGPRFSVAIAV